MRRTLSRTASLTLAPDAPAHPDAGPARDALASLAAAITTGGVAVTPARHRLAEAMLPLDWAELPTLDSPALATALPQASLADLARLVAIGDAEAALLERARASGPPGGLLAVIAILALPALPEAIAWLRLGRAQAARLLALELALASAPPSAAPAARAALTQALAELPPDLRGARAAPLPITRAALAREPWREDLAGLIARPAPAPPPAGASTPFRHAIRITLDQPLPAFATHGFVVQAHPALPAADWTILADGAPVFAQLLLRDDLSEARFASATGLPAGTRITASPPPGEYFRHYTAVAGQHGPIRPLPGPPPPLRITALSESCLEGFHTPEHLPGAIGRWMGQHGRIRLPACPSPLRATLHGRHRQELIAAGGLLAAIGDTALDLLFETLGKAHDAGEWLIHLHLPPTTLPGHGWLHLSLPELPPRGADESRDIGLIFLGFEVAPMTGAPA